MHRTMLPSPRELAVLLLVLGSLAAVATGTARSRDPTSTVHGVLALQGGADPTCSTGLRSNKDSTCCCAKSCGTCGGESCQSHPGGGTACCCGQIAKEGRNCSTFDPPCMLPPTPVPPPPPPATKVNLKRGFVADGKGSGSNVRTCDDPLLLNTSGWYYDYNVANPYMTQGLSGNCKLANETGPGRFAPMNWCLGSIDGDVPSYENRSFFMGFNEPNNLHNCNTDAADVAKAWGRVMAKWPNSTLVSPATAGNGIQWYDDFFGNCSKLYGATGCRITYLATHCYSCHADSTLAYLEELYKRYGHKVWLTEFSCGDNADAQPTARHLSFMWEVLPKLDAADFVYRYSWMSARDANGRRGLLETVNGSARLTELGKLYNA